MAIFETGVGGPQGSSVSIQTPVQDKTGVMALQALGGLVDVFDESRKSKAKAEAVAATSKQLGDFSSKADAIGQAFHQGAITKEQARVKLGQTYSSFVSGNVDAREDFADLYTKIAKNYGISEGKTVRTAQDEMEIATFERAYTNGFVSDSMTDEQKAEGMMAQKQIDAYRASMEVSQQQINLFTSRTDLSEKQRKLAEEAVVRDIQENLRGMSAVSYTRTQNQLGGVYARYKSNQTPEGKTQALAELAAIRSAIRQEAFSIGGGRIPKEEMDTLLAAHEEALRLAEMGISGEISDKVLEQELTRVKNQSQKEALANPQMRRAYGMVAVLGPNIISEKNAIELTASYLADTQNNDNVAPIPRAGDSQAARNLRDGAKVTMKSAQAIAKSLDELKPGAFRDSKLSEVQDIVTGQANMLAERAFDVEKPSLLRDSLQFLGSPEIASKIRAGELTISDPKQVVENIAGTYLRGIERTLNSTLQSTISLGGRQVPASEVFEIDVTGGTMRFNMKEGLVMTGPLESIRGLPTRQSLMPNSVRSSEVRRIKADLDNLAKSYNLGVNAVYSIDRSISSKSKVMEMLMGMGVVPTGLTQEELQATPPAPSVGGRVNLDKPLEEFTQEDFFAMAPDERRKVLARAGVNTPGEG